MSTQPLMKHEVVLPVIVDGYHWACNQDRMWVSVKPLPPVAITND